MPLAVNGDVTVPNSFTPNTVAASAQVNANHADHAAVDEIILRRRNLLIGGDFTTNPWQRGTTFAAIATAGYSADRWRVDYVTAGAVSVIKTDDAPTIAQAGISTLHCLHIDVTTADASLAATDYFVVGQRIEGLTSAFLGYGQAGATTVTLSFWVKSSLTGIHCVAVRNSAADRSYVAEYNVSAADTWERKTITIPGDTTGTWLATNGIGLNVTWALAAGTDFHGTADEWQAGDFVATDNQVNLLADVAYNFKLALVQLNVGDEAAPFDVVPFDNILQQCERYFQKSFALGTTPAQNVGTTTGEHVFPATVAGANPNFSPAFPLRTRMRGTPAMTCFNPSAANAQVRNISDGADCSSTALGCTDATANIVATGNAGCTVGDLLGFHWTASAEL